MRKVHFTSSPIWKFLSPRVTTKPPKIHLILTQSKIPFGYIQTLALGCYLQNFTKSYQVVFEKCSLYFISPLPYETPTNLFHFDSIKNSFWVHIDTGIRMLFTKFYKTLSSSFWKMLTLLHLPSPLRKFLSLTKCNRTPPPQKKNPYILIQSKIPFDCT